MISLAQFKVVRGSSRRVDDARAALEQSPHFRGRSHVIDITEHDGRLILSGRLPSFYLKQVLQTVIRSVDGVSEIENRVDVHWPSQV
jgi:osmotically-inducible protein OsmY